MSLVSLVYLSLVCPEPVPATVLPIALLSALRRNSVELAPRRRGPLSSSESELGLSICCHSMYSAWVMGWPLTYWYTSADDVAPPLEDAGSPAPALEDAGSFFGACRRFCLPAADTGPFGLLCSTDATNNVSSKPFLFSWVVSVLEFLGSLGNSDEVQVQV